MPNSRVTKYINAAIYKAHGRHRIDVVPGSDAPRPVGRTPHYTTPSGRPIRYPGAYRWAKVYHPSTRRIVVGERWLDSRARLRHGYTWGIDAVGIYAADRSGYRYHPTHGDVLRRQVEAKLREHRAAAKRFRADSRSLRNVLVMAADAAQTGSCRAGILAAAREARCIDGFANPYASVRAAVLLQVADRRADLRDGIIRAVKFGEMRETEVSI